MIDNFPGNRVKHKGDSYNEIIRSLLCVYFSGGSCIEDLSNHLKQTLSLNPKYKLCSSDTILRAMEELTQANHTYCSRQGNEYHFNSADVLNELLIISSLSTRHLFSGMSYDLDFDHLFIETEKYDAQMTYKKFRGYSPGVAMIGNVVVGIENRDGNASVRFCQELTLKRNSERLKKHGISIARFCADADSYSQNIIEEVETNCDFFYIRANRSEAFYDEMRGLSDWQQTEINYVPCELNSIEIKRWRGKTYRLVIQRTGKED